MSEINLTIIFMISAAVIAVQMEDLLSSIIAVGAVGIGLSIAFLLLKAPDLAIMQLVVEVLSLIILIRATVKKDLPFSASGRWLFNTISTVVFLALFLTLARFSLNDMPPFGNPAMRVSKIYIEEALAKTLTLNVVSAITLNYRVCDLLGEAAILFTALIGVLAIGRGVARAGGGSGDGK